MNLQEKLNMLTADFADAVLMAVRGASIDEILGSSSKPEKPRILWRQPAEAKRALEKTVKPAPAKKAKSSRLKRRTPEQIVEAVGVIASLLRRSKKGLRSEEIKKHLGLDAREMPRLLKEGLATGAIKILSGQKRATVYGVGEKSKAKKKVARKSAKKVRKPSASSHAQRSANKS